MHPHAVQAEAIEVEARLRELDLDLAIIRESALIGDHHARACREYDPPLLAGILRWAKKVGALRERLLPQGWTLNDHLNYSTVVHPSGAFGIAVATGDENTGQKDAVATTRHPRGPAARAAFERNDQLTFTFGLDPGVGLEHVTREGRLTYLLLIRAADDLIRAELNRPRETGPDGRPSVYAERILLPPFERGALLPGVAAPVPAEFEVDVERRSP